MRGLLVQENIPATPYNPIQQADLVRSQTISGLLVILLPTIFVCAIVGYRKYKAMLLQRRINWLSRLWQLDSSRELS